MSIYPFDEKLRTAIDSLEGCGVAWYGMLLPDSTLFSRLVAHGFEEIEVREQLSQLLNESTNNLVALARHDKRENLDRMSPARLVLENRDDREVFDAANKLTKSESGRDRALGYAILMRKPGQMFLAEARELVVAGFEHEDDADALELLAYAAMHLDIEGRSKFLKTLGVHPSAAVRQAVASSLGSEEDRQSISTLIKLTRDCSEDVRNWATFSLGSLCQRNTAPIREALFARVEDDHEETKNEAILGLAIRKDPRALQLVMDALQSESVWILALEAAEELANPALYPLLENLKTRWMVSSSDSLHMTALNAALETCHP